MYPHASAHTELAARRETLHAANVAARTGLAPRSKLMKRLQGELQVQFTVE